MSRAVTALIALVLALASAGLAWWLGVSHGEARQQAKQNTQLVADLTTVLNETRTLTRAANQASQRLRQTQGTRQGINQSTTKELTDALAPTADQRADCVLPAGGVRILSEAHDRAARAAAGGLAAGLPTAGTSAAER